MTDRLYDVVTFDCYGTLVDWEGGLATAFMRAGWADGVRLDRAAVIRAYMAGAILALAAAFCLVLVLGIAVVITLRSDWFHNAVRDRIVAEVEKATGGRAEIGKNDQAIRTLAGAKTLNELAGTMIPLFGGGEVRLDDLGTVTQVDRHGLDRANEVSLIDRETPTSGSELTVFEQFIGNIGRFNPPADADQ